MKISGLGECDHPIAFLKYILAYYKDKMNILNFFDSVLKVQSFLRFIVEDFLMKSNKFFFIVLKKSFTD